MDPMSMDLTWLEPCNFLYSLPGATYRCANTEHTNRRREQWDYLIRPLLHFRCQVSRLVDKSGHYCDHNLKP